MCIFFCLGFCLCLFCLCVVLLVVGLVFFIVLLVLVQFVGDVVVVMYCFDILVQLLGEVLCSFMCQFGMQVVYLVVLVNGVIFIVVSGELDVFLVLVCLLQGSGLVMCWVGLDVVMLEWSVIIVCEDGVIVIDVLCVVGDCIDIGGSGGDYMLDVYCIVGFSVYVLCVIFECFCGMFMVDIVKGVVGVMVGDLCIVNVLDFNICGIQGQSCILVIIDGGQLMMDIYCGYVGQFQCIYLDLDLIFSLIIIKGFSLGVNVFGGIGGVVEMEMLKVDDVLCDGCDSGVCICGGLVNNSVNNVLVYSGVLCIDCNVIGSWFFNIVVVRYWDSVDLVVVYVCCDQGNYFVGKYGYDDFLQICCMLVLLNLLCIEVFNIFFEFELFLIKGIWCIDENQMLEGGYCCYEGEQGEIMVLQIICVDCDCVLQWELGCIDLDVYNLWYCFNLDSDLVDLKVNFWYIDVYSLMYNGLIGIMLWYFDCCIEWYDGLIFNIDLGYKSVYCNSMQQMWLGLDVGNIMFLINDVGLFMFNYGLFYSDEDVGLGCNVLIMYDDLVNNCFLCNVGCKEYSVVVLVKWELDEYWELMLGGCYNCVDVYDCNCLVMLEIYGVIGQYCYMQLFNGNLNLLLWWVMCIVMLNWYLDVNGQFIQVLLLVLLYKQGMVVDIVGWNFYDVDDVEDLSVLVSWIWFKLICCCDSVFMLLVSVIYCFIEDMMVYVKYVEGVKLLSLFEFMLGLFIVVKLVGEFKFECVGIWEVGVSIVQYDLFVDGDCVVFKLVYFDICIDDLIICDYCILLVGYICNIDCFKVLGMEFQFNYDVGKVFVDLLVYYYFQVKICVLDIVVECCVYGVQCRIEELKNMLDCVDGGFEGFYSNIQNLLCYMVNMMLGLCLFDEWLIFGMCVIYNVGLISKLDKEWNVGLLVIQQLYCFNILVDLFVSWCVIEQLVVDVNVDNLIDCYYLDLLVLGIMLVLGCIVWLVLIYCY